MQREGERLRWDHVTAAVLLAAMATIAFLNILGRYLFHYSLAFTEELTINLFVWLTVVGSGIAFERGAQLGMVSLFRVLPLRCRRIVVIAGTLLSILLFVIVDVLLVRTIYFEMTLFHAVSPALGIPVWIYYAGVPVFSVGAVLGICRGARRTLVSITLEQAERKE